jgi:hypothetical protein
MATTPKVPSAAPKQPLLPTADLERLIGTERRLGEVGHAIVSASRILGAKNVATLHVTCSDEREKECADDFVNSVVREVGNGPFTRRAPMRTANLGARYEWGSAGLALNHFAAEGTEKSLLILKTSSHVGYVEQGGMREYGIVDRELLTSTSCGALGCLLGGVTKPFSRELELLFGSEGLDRLGMLRDSTVVSALERSAAAGVINARLQARKAFLDISEQAMADLAMAPQHVLVVACMTLNRPGVDHELLVGFYSGARDPKAPGGFQFTWTGLSGDPRQLEISHTSGALSMTSTGVRTRFARGPKEHRRLPLVEVLGNPETPAPVQAAVDHAVDEIQTSLRAEKSPAAKLALAGVAVVIGEVMPVAGLALLLSSGAIELHHTWRVHRVASGQASDAEARALFEEICVGFDHLNESEAQLVVNRLAAGI